MTREKSCFIIITPHSFFFAIKLNGSNLSFSTSWVKVTRLLRTLLYSAYFTRHVQDFAVLSFFNFSRLAHFCFGKMLENNDIFIFGSHFYKWPSSPESLNCKIVLFVKGMNQLVGARAGHKISTRINEILVKICFNYPTALSRGQPSKENLNFTLSWSGLISFLKKPCIVQIVVIKRWLSNNCREQLSLLPVVCLKIILYQNSASAVP